MLSPLEIRKLKATALLIVVLLYSLMGCCWRYWDIIYPHNKWYFIVSIDGNNHFPGLWWLLGRKRNIYFIGVISLTLLPPVLDWFSSTLTIWCIPMFSPFTDLGNHPPVLLLLNIFSVWLLCIAQSLAEFFGSVLLLLVNRKTTPADQLVEGQSFLLTHEISVFSCLMHFHWNTVLFKMPSPSHLDLIMLILLMQQWSMQSPFWSSIAPETPEIDCWTTDYTTGSITLQHFLFPSGHYISTVSISFLNYQYH